MRFSATLELSGRTATGVEVPEEVVRALGRGKRVPVVVTVGSHSYRSTIASMGGRYMLPFSAENRQAAGVAAGDVLEVDLEVDDAPRSVEVPEDLASALASAPDAGARFAALSYSAQLRHVLAVQGAKTPQTRERRIAKVIGDLSG
jgi:hypothetical protein